MRNLNSEFNREFNAFLLHRLLLFIFWILYGNICNRLSEANTQSYTCKHLLFYAACYALLRYDVPAKFFNGEQNILSHQSNNLVTYILGFLAKGEIEISLFWYKTLTTLNTKCKMLLWAKNWNYYFWIKKPRRVFLPFYFVGEKPRGGKTLRGNFLFPLEAQYNAESFWYTFYYALWWIIIQKSQFEFF